MKRSKNNNIKKRRIVISSTALFSKWKDVEIDPVNYRKQLWTSRTNLTVDAPSQTILKEEIKAAVEEMKLIRAGKKKARNVEDFLKQL